MTCGISPRYCVAVGHWWRLWVGCILVPDCPERKEEPFARIPFNQVPAVGVQLSLDLHRGGDQVRRGVRVGKSDCAPNPSRPLARNLRHAARTLAS